MNIIMNDYLQLDNSLVAVHLFSVAVRLVKEVAVSPNSPNRFWHIHVTVPRKRLSDSEAVDSLISVKVAIFPPLWAEGSFIEMIPRVPLLAQALIVEMEQVRILTQRHLVLELCMFRTYLHVVLELCLLWVPKSDVKCWAGGLSTK